jgi:hypothetical protein
MFDNSIFLIVLDQIVPEDRVNRILSLCMDMKTMSWGDCRIWFVYLFTMMPSLPEINK